MSTSVLKALPGKLDIKRHSPKFLYILTVHVIVKVPTLPCPPETSLGAVTGNVAGVFIVTGITKGNVNYDMIIIY